MRQKTTIADVYKFNLENMAWSTVSERVELVIEKEPFAEGGFQEVYKARSPTASYSERLWVVKKYLPKTLQSISQLGQTIEDHTKKAVQMQSLAKNTAHSMYAKVRDILLRSHFYSTSAFYVRLFVCKENISTNNKQILTNVCANTLVPWSIDQRLTITVFFSINSNKNWVKSWVEYRLHSRICLWD